MRKVLLLIALFVGQFALAAKNNIHLVPHDPPLDPDEDARSIINEVTAFLYDQVLIISFSNLTTSQVIVFNSLDQISYNQTYPSAYSVQADLSSLPSGCYTLYVFAYDVWWYGFFVL